MTRKVTPVAAQLVREVMLPHAVTVMPSMTIA